ncbi:MAG TPA: adenylate/guanylate cyclase domain-containing protein, partial [Myxococcales bacterium]|nr:adenylate/guanylate cyclase domain-containing protein [Myxococcales bacterium]
MRLPALFKPSAFKLALAVSLLFAWVRWEGRDSAAGTVRVIRNMEHWLGDLRFVERTKIGHPEPPSTTVLIAEDEKSIAKVGLWPWPRAFYAKLIDKLTAAGAKAIVFDVAFIDSYGGGAPDDGSLADAIHRSGKTVQAVLLLGNGEVEHLDGAKRAAQIARVESGAIGAPMSASLETGGATQLTPMRSTVELQDYPALQAPLPDIARAASWFGYFNAVPDDDGVIRSVPLLSRVGKALYLPAIDLAAVAVACGAPSPHFVTPLADNPDMDRLTAVSIDCADRALTIPVSALARMPIDYPITWRQYPTRSAIDVVDGDFPPEAIRGKVAVVAATAEGTHDLRSTPLDSPVPGGVTHVAAIDQILRGQFLRRPSWTIAVELLLLLGFGLGFGALFASLAIPWAMAALAAGVLGYHATAYLFFAKGLDVCAALPILELLALFPVAIVYRYLTEEREKRFIREAFRYYLTASVMDAVLADPSRLKLGGEKRELTVLFSDIRGFTTLSEHLPPEQLVHMLNDYLTPMTDVVFENGGTLDKYMGDAIMAFFGAPVDQPDHALRACRTATQMLEKLAELKARWAAEGLPPIDIGIGINSGPMVVGNMGSQSRFDYTVMGDAVNLGSRLEGTNKLYGTNAIMSESTFAQVKESVVARELDSVVVKGKEQPVRIYELIAVGVPPAAWLAEGGPELVKAYEMALLCYRARRLDEAEQLLQQITARWPDDVPASKLLERCRTAKSAPEGEAWTGVS